MNYMSIKWIDDCPEQDIIRYLIESVGYFALNKYGDIRIKREDIIRYENRVNDFIETFLKTNLRVKIPLKEKDEDDIAWCEARVHRKVDFVLHDTQK